MAVIGSRQPIKKVLSSPGETDSNFPMWKKLVAGTLAGAISSALCSPTDLLKVRLQADKAGTRYKGLADAFLSIVKQEGVLGLYRGWWLWLCVRVCVAMAE